MIARRAPRRCWVRYSARLGGSALRLVVAAGPRGPEAHHISRHDDDAPVLARLLGRLRDEPELDSESLDPKGSDLDPLITHLTQRGEQLIPTGYPCVRIHRRPRPQVVDRGRQELARF